MTKELRFWDTTETGWRGIHPAILRYSFASSTPLIFLGNRPSSHHPRLYALNQRDIRGSSIRAPYNLSVEAAAFVNLAGGLGLLLCLSLESLSMYKLGFEKIGDE